MTLSAAPTELRLVFTEAVELAFTRVGLRGPNGAVQLRIPAFTGPDRRTIVSPIAVQLSAGQYTVTWQIAGADGHPVRGSFTFSVAAGASGLAPPPILDAGLGTGAPNTGSDSLHAHHDPATFPDAGRFAAGSPLYVMIRWLQFTAILVLTGAVAFKVVVLALFRKNRQPDSPMLGPASRRAANVGFYAALVLAVVVLLRLLAQSYAMHAPGSGFAPALMWPMIGRTIWGWGWLLQFLATAVAIAGFFAARKDLTRGWGIAAAGAVLGAFAPALSGHAASAPMLRPLAIFADGVHILGASGWLGSLLVLLVAGIPAAMRLDTEDRGPAVADLVGVYSPTALIFAGVTAVAGIFSGWIHLGTIPALWQTEYGKTLLVKLAVLGIVTVTGAYNFLYVRPRLGKIEGVKSIRRSATIEVGVAVVVLLVTAVLVATPTAMDITK
ncbi:MAG: copper resistance protein CopC/CopD [Gemmatimonadota bacterium]|nr:copper resistance protein CopC/CopD [Gemmatimonadota bacterium]